MERTRNLTPAEFEATKDKIAKINARAEKRGFTGRIEVSGKRTVKTEKNALGFEVEKIWYETTLTGTPPAYEGWEFQAALEWDPYAGLIVRTAPGVESIDRSTLVEGACDHCKLNRNRKNAYVVKNTDDGRQVQVGSTCIKDFLGWDGSFVFYSTDEVDEDLDSFLGGGAYYQPSWTPETVLAAAWAAIQVNGYVRSGEMGSTKETVLAILDPRSKWDREAAREYAPLIEDSADMAVLIKDWVLSDEFSGHSDYVQNLKAITDGDYVSARNVGFLASAPQAWARAQAKDLKRKQERAEIKDSYLAEVGDRIEVKARIKYINYIDGYYGTTTLYTLLTDTGHLVKWFSSNGALGDTVDNTLFTLRGTVKDHDEYQGTKSTILTRCKVLAEEPQEDLQTVTQ